MESLQIRRPNTLAQALEAKAEHPDAVPLAGGTDLMVAINFRHTRPAAVLDLTAVPELDDWAPDDGRVRVGAGVTYTRLIDELGDRLPGLAIAGRTVGSPQIRNRGTVGGNLATASPAGDGLPPLYTAGALVELASVRGTRHVPVAEFITGPKRTCIEPDELIAAFELPAASGPQQFAKVGTRNAMVIAVCSVALALWPEQRRVAACVGSAGPTPLVATEAEEFIAGALDWNGGAPIPEDALERFGELVGACARPIDDVRGTARYRSHAVGVLGRRTLQWAWSAYA
ncbi:MAG TPA: FAD binding domain-containing protein [Solirubrobacteraceae bacterium]|nr:FAD binding domain-containing protein [Solirubrobacteraceae bacterium]